MKIACISDTHGLMLPEIESDTDIIFHAGDIGPDRNAEHWLKTDFSSWAMDFGKSIHLTWGNHDFIGYKRSVLEEMSLPPNVHFHVDEAVDIEGLKVWFSPWSPRFGDWAFMATEAQLARFYEDIPLFTDIIVSHSPPFGYCDYTALYGEKHVGSTALLNYIRNGKIKYVVCGHIHEGWGIEPLPNGMTKIINCSQVDEHYKPRKGAVIYIEWP